ncbi:MAG TPA: hypothetical protein VHV79_04520 [Mycobacteriales bacterium]|jgi:hypothetical protein|nr:hypothetical protein [Mycobacteriales bacterium]
MSRVEVARHVAADPASVALLLAELAAEDGTDHGLVVTSPRRAGIGFAARLEFVHAGGAVLVGEIVVAPSSGEGCDVRAGFGVPDDSPIQPVERGASAFLAALAAHAKSRAFAA